MTAILRREPEDVVRRLAICAAVLGGATVVAAGLQAWLGIADASAIYLLAIVPIAGRYGTLSGVSASVIAFLVYDYLFTAPRFTFNVTNPQEWLSLLLFLVVAVVIGRLAALQADRASEADRRAGEAQAMFGISRALATSPTIDAAAAEILERLVAQTGLERIWIAFGATPEAERLVADSGAPGAGPESAVGITPWVLVRMPGDEPAEWIRAHEGSVGAGSAAIFRVLIEADGETLGSLWGSRPEDDGLPGRGATRSLSLAADQLGLAQRRERLAEAATSAEIARRSDALKSALLDSVSHDLRTPLATIRALAGGLLDDGVPLTPIAVRESAATIDEEALRLSEIVHGLLDLSRIEAGELKPNLALHELAELVETVVRRGRAGLGRHQLEVAVPDDLTVLVDALFFDQALTNVYENAIAHSEAGARIRIRATRVETQPDVALVVEDSGPGMTDAGIKQVFDKFYRGQGVEGGSRHGLGIGLTVARGLTEAMGATVTAGVSELGGLAVTFRLAGPGMTEGGALLLLIEDDLPTRRALVANLAGHGHQVDEAGTAAEGLRAWEDRRPDLILLDLGLPDRDGLTIIRQVRREASTPILVLSARGDERDRVTALEQGADDYLTKPFGLAELRARIAALLRRAAGPLADAGGLLSVGPVNLDIARREVRVGEQLVELTPREYELLKVLLGRAGSVVTRGRLLRAVWGAAYSEESHYLHVYVSRLRRKLAAAGAPDLIVAEPGVGYRVLLPEATTGGG